MIVFQVKAQSHRLSTLQGKEKDVIKKYFYIQHQVHRRHRGARKTAKPSKIKARSSRPRTNCSVYRCAYNVHNFDAQQHRAGQIISPLTLQIINIAQMLFVGGEGDVLQVFYSSGSILQIANIIRSTVIMTHHTEYTLGYCKHRLNLMCNV